MIEAKQEPLPHSAFDYSHYIRDPAGMIMEKKRKDGAWNCVCVKATDRGYFDDDWFIDQDGKIFEEDIRTNDPTQVLYDPMKDSGPPVRYGNDCNESGCHRSPAWRSGGTRKNPDGVDNNAPPDWTLY